VFTRRFGLVPTRRFGLVFTRHFGLVAVGWLCMRPGGLLLRLGWV